MTNFEKAVFSNTLDCYGMDSQIRIAEEELNELQKELFKWQRGEENRNHILEEMADVSIVFDQLKMMFNISDGELQKKRTAKINRLVDRLNSAVLER
ncbi:MAG: hypothetical protein K2M82_01040 [Lachnospiraceae bacterium]|nr:hypothetical protein [Lachnospiraceae bacterium]